MEPPSLTGAQVWRRLFRQLVVANLATAAMLTVSYRLIAPRVRGAPRASTARSDTMTQLPMMR